MSDKPTIYKEKDFRERVSKSVQANIGMLIPEEEFDSLVQEEIKAFFEEEIPHVTIEKKAYSYGDKDKIIQALKITPFRKMIWEEVESQIKEKVKDDFKNSEVAKAVSKLWKNDGRVEFTWNDFVVELTKEIAPQLAEKMFERIVAEAMEASATEVLNKIQNY